MESIERPKKLPNHRPSGSKTYAHTCGCAHANGRAFASSFALAFALALAQAFAPACSSGGSGPSESDATDGGDIGDGARENDGGGENDAGGDSDAGGKTDDADAPGEPVVTEIGIPIDEALTQIIGPEGGALADPAGRLTVEIPAGALTTDTALSIQSITNTAPGGVGDAFALRPEGQTFLVPVTLHFASALGDTDGSSSEFMHIAFQRANGTWGVVSSTVAETGEIISAKVSHFSDWSRILEASLNPRSAQVAVGDQRAFYVELCLLESSDETGDVVDLNSCRKASANFGAANISQWTVNGKSGGDTQIGTLTPHLETATYEAPTKVPSPKQVTIGVRVTNPANARTIDLRAPVTIVPNEYPPLYRGIFAYRSTYAIDSDNVRTQHYKLSLTFRRTSTDPREGSYKLDFVNASGGEDEKSSGEGGSITTCTRTYDDPVNLIGSLGVAGGYPEDGTQTVFQGQMYIDGYGTERCERDGSSYPPDEQYPLSYSFPVPFTTCGSTDLVVKQPDGRVDRLTYSKRLICSDGKSTSTAHVALEAIWP
ncbi:MAG: hypothetical protein H6729_02225 [Deltaproteobacteria bacterium]|nr:hypothetical protein [Deltaproteobacteria bacterium]